MAYCPSIREGPQTVQIRKDASASDKSETPEDEEAVLPTATINLLVDSDAVEITHGTGVALVAEILDACDGMQLQWQYAEYDEEGTDIKWMDVADGSEATHKYILDEENENWLWRLLITVPEKPENDTQENNGDLMDTDEPVEDLLSIETEMSEEEAKPNALESEDVTLEPADTIGADGNTEP